MAIVIREGLSFTPPTPKNLSIQKSMSYLLFGDDSVLLVCMYVCVFQPSVLKKNSSLPNIFMLSGERIL